MSVNERGTSLKRRRYFARFWQVATGFWRGPSRRRAWTLTAILITVILVQLYLQYRLNVWNKDIFNALEKKDLGQVKALAMLFVPIAFGVVLTNVASTWGRLTTQRSWRDWLSRHLVDNWLANGRYYQLNLIQGEHQNPEFRIADDARIATDAPVDFVFGVTTAFLTAVTFITVLWGVGGSIEVGGWTIPGYLVFVAVIYSLITTGLMLFIGRHFVRIAEGKNQAEAEYRYAATRLRENGESIALLGGEPEERSSLGQALAKVIERWRQLCGQYMRTSAVSYGNFVLAPVIPVILSAPKYLAGTMSLGEVMQAASAFVTVQTSFTWLVENYPRLADWTASANRVAGLIVSLDRLKRAEAHGSRRIERTVGPANGPALRLDHVSVTLDDGTAVVGETEVAIDRGEKVLVVGESGTGKSTLIRAIAGLWPWGEGRVMVREGAKLFFMPQRPYVPIGTLKRAVAYPNAAEDVSDEAVIEALEAAGLGHLRERVHEDAPWERTLSGGEQQRLAFAQLFIQKPTLIVMDEATAALDPESQDVLLRRIGERLPDSAIVSVGHRPELEAFHDRRLVLARREDGAKLVADEPLNAGGRGLRRKILGLGRRRQQQEAAE